MKRLLHVGLDVHARTIAVAVADGEGVRYVGIIDHDVAKLKKLLGKLGKPGNLTVVYEAGPTGFGLCRALRVGGYSCAVIAPTLIPSMAGDRVKTDRKDAMKLAQLSQAGLLQEVFVPEVEQEALRDLVRAREAAKSWQKKAGQQLDKFLLRHDRRPKDKMTKWTEKHVAWIRSQKFELPAQQVVFVEYLTEYEHQRERVRRLESHLHEASTSLPGAYQALIRSLVALKGVRFLTAVTLVSEIGDMMRFAHPTQLMSYTGVVPGEHSTGDDVRRGPITKSGNAHIRRIIGESAWCYARGLGAPSREVKKRRTGLSAEIVAIAERADARLHRRYRALSARGKHKNKVTIAVGRELLGFVWAIGVQAQLEHARAQETAA
jgi:transposase